MSNAELIWNKKKMKTERADWFDLYHIIMTNSFQNIWSGFEDANYVTNCFSTVTRRHRNVLILGFSKLINARESMRKLKALNMYEVIANWTGYETVLIY